MTRTIPGRGYEIVVVVGDEPVDADCDILDVVVKFDGGRHQAAVFTTLRAIRSRIDHYKNSGECASGLYFWTSDMIIVERLTLDVIQRTVEDLLKTDSFDLAFSGPSFDIGPAAAE